MRQAASIAAFLMVSLISITGTIIPAYAFAPDTPLSSADGSFLGEFAADDSGKSIASGGDVNGDGFDDILIGADRNDEGALNAGQIYLIFGKQAGWTMDSNLATVADASFIGEGGNHYSGASVAFAGDVNGDGFDDIIIGSPYYDEGT